MISGIHAVFNPAGTARASDKTTASEAVEFALPESDTEAQGRSGVDTDAYDTVCFSKAGSLLGAVPLILPTAANVQRMSEDLAGSLNELFVAEGLETSPPVTFSVNPDTGYVTVEGDRQDIDAIEEMINGNDAMKNQIREISAISSHVAAMAEAMRFNQEYAAAMTPADVNAVVEKYASLLSGNRSHPEITLVYDGTCVVNVRDAEGVRRLDA